MNRSRTISRNRRNARCSRSRNTRKRINSWAVWQPPDLSCEDDKSERCRDTLIVRFISYAAKENIFEIDLRNVPLSKNNREGASANGRRDDRNTATSISNDYSKTIIISLPFGIMIYSSELRSRSPSQVRKLATRRESSTGRRAAPNKIVSRVLLFSRAI